MKILYFGGQKSGKSNLAEKKSLSFGNSKPYYIATYDDSFNDTEMKQRVKKHKNLRENKFITIEEPKDLPKVIKDKGTYLIDCLSMWILNNIDLNEEKLISQIEGLSTKVYVEVEFEKE